jgi:hypothetical protein
MTTPSSARLDADHVLSAIAAATSAATEDGPPVHPAAHRDAVLALYLRALGFGLALVGAELAALRQELVELTKATYSAGGA